MKEPEYAFLKEAGRIINSGQARSICLTGNIMDLFYSPGADDEGRYVSLLELLVDKWAIGGTLVVIYELNGPIRFMNKSDQQKMRDAWGRLYKDEDQVAIDLALARTQKRLAEVQESTWQTFDASLRKAETNPTYALEFLRQLCLCSRLSREGVPFLWEDLLILIEGADFILPEGEIAQLSEVDRQRIAICRDWVSDPGFMNAGDSVVFLAESTALINSKVAQLPQLLNVEVGPPGLDERLHIIRWFNKQLPADGKLNLWDSQETLARMTAGLSAHALFQLLRDNAHRKNRLQPQDVVDKVESFIQDQLGEDVVEFKKPEHGLKDVVGFSRLKQFMRDEFIPRIQSTGKAALSGAAIGGPIGSGKSFLLEAVAGELGMVVLVLKNIRSKWFGGTDILFERLRRIILALDKSLVFVDEADTQFGGVGEDVHDTERRLTGKIQAMMSDPALKGKASWLLITARIHRLSPDIRRPGRAGSLIIPILDPEGEDLDDFISWMIRPVFEKGESCPTVAGAVELLKPDTLGYYAASFSEVRSDLIAVAEFRKQSGLSIEEIREVLHDRIPPAVEKMRRYQKLQALLNCTRLSLLPAPVERASLDELREGWRREILTLEAEGIE